MPIPSERLDRSQATPSSDVGRRAHYPERRPTVVADGPSIPAKHLFDSGGMQEAAFNLYRSLPDSCGRDQ